VIERHVTFEVIPGKEQAFEDLFKSSYSTAMSKQRGFVSVGLVRELEAPTRYQMVIRFDTLENAVAWRDSADHKAISPVIKALYSGSSVVAYSIIATVPA
jgi:antibiotic biosynthesis monooxygenase (ABM) superfamily enzyme